MWRGSGRGWLGGRKTPGEGECRTGVALSRVPSDEESSVMPQ